ncbi:MAG: isoprenylcysteine carboxylmethyltransferase family protein [Anaerolineae bacterium]|nr:isoprenylcysteine carboxylmethyltransferase family protein [Anaerolineae bacterium]
MFTERQREEGLVEEILSRGDLSAEEIKEKLWKKNVSFVRSYDRHCTRLFCPLVVLWFLPAIAKWSGWGFLSFFARLPRVSFPMVVILTGAIFVIVAIALEAKAGSMRQKRGGCHDLHESIVIVREGPYKVIRHPGYLAELIYFPLLPIVLSRWVPFTILAVVYIVVWTGAIVYLLKAEDNFNLRKWGEEYRRYVKQVPAINFVKGLKKLKEETS